MTRKIQYLKKNKYLKMLNKYSLANLKTNGNDYLKVNSVRVILEMFSIAQDLLK